jgi:calcineurin-like phosphoesterase family protein
MEERASTYTKQSVRVVVVAWITLICGHLGERHGSNYKKPKTNGTRLWRNINVSNIFLTSDSHFGHVGVTKFLAPNGVDKLRPWDTIEEMDEALIENWNKVVRPQDKVYHLGDVVINRRALPTLARLNGTKILIKGNHDVFRLEEYTPYFKDVRGSGELAGYVLTHIPIHPQSLERWKGNFHGHLHAHSVLMQDPGEYAKCIIKNPSYLCVSVEQTNFTPISLEEAKKRMKEQNEQ